MIDWSEIDNRYEFNAVPHPGLKIVISLRTISLLQISTSMIGSKVVWLILGEVDPRLIQVYRLKVFIKLRLILCWLPRLLQP